MSRRLEIELTSERPDGTWTWRAAGAKQPKGDLDGAILPSGTAVGTVLRVDAEFLVEGIEIIGVLPPKAERKEPELLQLIGSGREEPLVTTQLAPKGRGGKGRRDRDDWDGGGADRGRGRGRGDRPDRGDRGDRGDRDARPRGPRPEPVPERPAPKRLRPGRSHRTAVLDEIPPEMRPIAEQVLRGGIPAVREQANKQNEKARQENRPEIPVDQVVAMAEQLLPRLRSAEWRDRADAALRDLEELDLRDLRSVVVAADGGARDEESRAIRDELSAGLTRRVDQEQQLWVADIAANLDAGRFVRALRISSRPPKAGAPVPTELNARLVAAVSEGLNERTKQELYAAALDALSFAPMRSQVVPAGRPAEPTEELLEGVRRSADKLPAIAALFGVDPKEANAARRRRRASKPAKAGASKPAKAGASKPEDGRSEAPRTGDAKSDKPGDAAKPQVESPEAIAPAEDESSDAPETAPEAVVEEAVVEEAVVEEAPTAAE